MTTEQKQLLGINLELPKERYSSGEQITATVTLKNQSRIPITINKRMGINPERMPEGTWEVKFDVIFPPGERPVMGTLINRGKPRRQDFISLSPGEQISRAYVLTDFYWMRLPGIYEVKAAYRNTNDGSKFGLCAWSGEITSNSMRFRVSE